MALLGVVPAGAHSAASAVSDPVVTGSAFALGAQEPEVAGSELPWLRTRKSRSYRLADGSVVARVWGNAVNYRDASGEWQAIDNRLEVAGSVVRNRANRYRADLPVDLGEGAIRLADGDEWVSLRPVDAAGTARVSGAAATYSAAWPGVDAKYEVIGESIKETLTLAGPAAAGTFRFAVAASGGLSARVSRAGAVELRDARGEAAWSLTAPVMVDANGTPGKVDVSVERTASGWELSLSPSRAWLADPGRAWPVVIDPSVSPGSSEDCLVSNESGFADASFCGYSFLEAGYGYSPGSHDHHALLKFDVQSAVPAGADVLEASLWLYLTGEEGTASKEITAHRVTNSWTSSVSWNTRDGVNAWTTPGGDFATAGSDDGKTINGSTSPGWKDWHVFDMVDGWSTGRYANHGVLLAEDGAHSALGTMLFESAEGDPAKAPHLDIWYNRRTGARRGYALERFRLSDRINLAVNPGSGNLLVQQTDLTVPGGTGPDLVLSRAYNSLQPKYGAFTKGWTWDVGDDRLLIWYPDAIVVYGPSGTQVRFEENPDGSYQTPAGFDETLVYNGNSTWTLTEHKSQRKTLFGVGGRVQTVEDRNGRQISFDYDSSGIHADSITDAQGRVTTVERTDPDLPGAITKITDPAGREYCYGLEFVNGQKLLTSYTDPSGGVTEYDYDSANRLSKITTPGGRETKIDYYTSGAREGKVLTVTRVTDPVAESGPVTEFDYDNVARDGSSTATVTDPRSHETNYEFDTSGRPTTVTDALGRDAKTSYTSNSNVEKYTEPTNTGLTPNITLSYDSRDNPIRSKTITGAGTTDADKLITESDYSTDPWPGHTVAGAGYLATEVRDEQDTAAGRSGTVVEYHTDEGNPTKITKAGSQITLAYAPASGTGASWDGKPGQLASSTDGNSHTTTYDYDAHGNLTTITPPPKTGGGTLIGSTTIDYDGASGDDLALSRPTRVTDGNGNCAEYQYDELDRITRITYKTGCTTESAHYEYTYDHDGNLTERDDVASLNTKVYTFTYDDLNRVTEEALPGNLTNAYDYDAASNLTSVTDAGGTVAYGYDAINRQHTIQEPGAASAITYTYTDDASPSDDVPEHGQKVEIAMPNGVTTTNKLDAASRMVSTESRDSASTVLQSLAYDYLNGANQTALVASETDALNSTAIDYGYDTLNRLLSATDSGGDDFAYTYDDAGNITSRIINGGTPRIYRHDEDNELCWSYDGSSSADCDNPPTGAIVYHYDDAGNQTYSGGDNQTYNAQNQFTAFNSTAFSYAGPGQTQRTAHGSTSTANNLLGVGAETTSGTTDYFTRDQNQRLVSQRRPSASSPNRRTYVLADRLGSTRALTDENGTVVRRYAYDPYGNDASPSGSWTTTTPFKFAGGQEDASGLYHFGARYYDPYAGNWTQPDPIVQIADLQQANLYTYVGCDPANNVDPTGQSLLKKIAGAAVATAGLVAGGALTAACIYYTSGIETIHCAQIGVGVATEGVMLGAALYTDD